jgi:hypothetical protein
MGERLRGLVKIKIVSYGRPLLRIQDKEMSRVWERIFNTSKRLKRATEFIEKWVPPGMIPAEKKEIDVETLKSHNVG